MSSWGKPRTFRDGDDSRITAVPHVNAPAFEPATLLDRIDSVLVIDKHGCTHEQMKVLQGRASAYVGSVYGSWLEVDA